MRERCDRCGSRFTDDLPGMSVLGWFVYCGPCHPVYWQDFLPLFRAVAFVELPERGDEACDQPATS